MKAALLALSLFQPVHSWYPLQCCSERDCHEIEGVRETRDGYRLPDGRLVGHDKAKVSPDGGFHVCEDPAKTILCFFAPPGGV